MSRRAARPQTGAIDLFAWRDIAEARTVCEAAAVARDEAGRRYRYAPHGEIINRRAAFQEATEKALRAEAELAAMIARSAP